MKQTIEFNEEEANQLIQLLNIANKAEGLKVSQACVYFHSKLNQAFQNVSLDQQENRQKEAVQASEKDSSKATDTSK